MYLPNVPKQCIPHVRLDSITLQNISHLAELNADIFPVSYGEKFYNEVLCSGELAKLIYYNNRYAAAICCRLETFSDNRGRIYLMTLGVLDGYRKLGLGSILFQHIMDYVRRLTKPIITSIYLHVQTVNDVAIKFYLKNGFQIEAIVHDYYKLKEDRDAYILSRPIYPITTHYYR